MAGWWTFVLNLKRLDAFIVNYVDIVWFSCSVVPQKTLTSSTRETLQKGVKYVQNR